MTPAFKVRTALGLALGFLALAAILLYRNTVRTADASRYVSHTQEVEKALGGLAAQLGDAESSLRGFVIAGDPQFLLPERAAERELPRSIDALASLIRDNPVQSARIAGLRRATEARLAFNREVIALRTARGMTAAADRVASGAGQRLMDDARVQLDALRAEERRLLAERNAEVEQLTRRTRLFALALFTLLVISAAAAARLAIEDRRARRQADAAVRNSEARLRMLLEAVKDYAIFILDPEGRVATWNPGAQRIYRFTTAEAMGMHLSAFYPAADAEAGKPQDELREARERGWFQEQGVRVRKGGEEFWVDAVLTPMRDESGELRGYAKIVRDVTERRRAEEQLRQFAQKLAESNRELQDFAMVASHDLQEPLRKVQMFGDKLKRKFAEGLGPEGQDYVSRMQLAAARGQALIQGLLAFSRVTTKAQPPAPVDLGQTAREVVSDLEGRLNDVEGRVELGELPVVEADPLQMRQLLQNLIGNALKFRKPGEPPVVKVHASSDEGEVRLTVEDNGIGFDEKYTDRIFKLFQRLHERGQYEGSGMGLAICRKIVERHGGRIRARSQPGQGSTFIVELPAHATHQVH